MVLVVLYGYALSCVCCLALQLAKNVDELVDLQNMLGERMCWRICLTSFLFTAEGGVPLLFLIDDPPFFKKKSDKKPMISVCKDRHDGICTRIGIFFYVGNGFVGKIDVQLAHYRNVGVSCTGVYPTWVGSDLFLLMLLFSRLVSVH